MFIYVCIYRHSSLPVKNLVFRLCTSVGSRMPWSGQRRSSERLLCPAIRRHLDGDEFSGSEQKICFLLPKRISSHGHLPSSVAGSVGRFFGGRNHRSCRSPLQNGRTDSAHSISVICFVRYDTVRRSFRRRTARDRLPLAGNNLILWPGQQRCGVDGRVRRRGNQRRPRQCFR